MSSGPTTSRSWQSVGPGDEHAALEARTVARRGNRRRLLVFGLTFIIALAAGQAWNLSRPSEYRSSTRLQLNLPELARPGSSASAAFATKLQLFDSRPMLAKLGETLTRSGVATDSLGAEPEAKLQSMLQVLPVPSSEVVELRATGTDPRLLAAMLNAVPELVRSELAARQAKEADAQLAAARQELSRLERTAADRRARLDAYRQRADVAAERDDNEAVARSKGLNRALDTAVEKEAAAAARLASVNKAVEQGKSSTQARTDPTLSSLETRAHQLREDLKELERSYTQDFLAMDPRARAMRARLSELENQIVAQRSISLQAAQQAAQEDYTSAQAQVERLRAQLHASRPALTKTNARFNEAKVLEDDLAQVDKARRDLLERVSRLEADDARRVAMLTVVEAATVPSAPFRPDKWLDGTLVLGGAAALALLVMGTVELFNRAAPAIAPTSSTTVLLTPGWAGPQAQIGAAGVRATPLLAADPAAPAALPAPLQVLSQPEATALLAASGGRTRLLCALALMGLTADEALRLHHGDFDAAALRLNVGGAWARQLAMPPWMPKLLVEGTAGDRLVLQDASGQALDSADVASIVVSAALDAQLPQAVSVSWEVLRDTAIDWLVAQGLRYSELPKVMGRVDAQKLQAMSLRHGDARRQDLASIDALMPALRLDPDA
jgi:succinoglycan biosynthesis transport protein ExoP